MQELEHSLHYPNENCLSSSCAVAACLDTGLCQLDVPVAVNVPDKVVKLLTRNAQLKCFEVLVYFLGKGVELAYYPLILHCKIFGETCELEVIGQVHHDKSGSVPQLVCKVSGSLYLVLDVAHIISGSIACCKHKAESVCAVLVDDLQRVDAVAQRLGHLSALRVSYQTVDKNGIERSLAHILNAAEHHSDYPEEDDIIACYQCVCGIEILKIFSVVGPAQCGERPQCGGEPCVQSVGILSHRLAALGANCGAFLCNDHLAAVVAVECGYLMTPPYLTGDAPVTDIFKPVIIYFVKTLWNELCLAILYSVDSRLCKRLHLNEPLS